MFELVLVRDRSTTLRREEERPGRCLGRLLIGRFQKALQLPFKALKVFLPRFELFLVFGLQHADNIAHLDSPFVHFFGVNQFIWHRASLLRLPGGLTTSPEFFLYD